MNKNEITDEEFIEGLYDNTITQQDLRNMYVDKGVASEYTQFNWKTGRDILVERFCALGLPSQLQSSRCMSAWSA